MAEEQELRVDGGRVPLKQSLKESLSMIVILVVLGVLLAAVSLFNKWIEAGGYLKRVTLISHTGFVFPVALFIVLNLQALRRDIAPNRGIRFWRMHILLGLALLAVTIVCDRIVPWINGFVVNDGIYMLMLGAYAGWCLLDGTWQQAWAEIFDKGHSYRRRFGRSLTFGLLAVLSGFMVIGLVLASRPSEHYLGLPHIAGLLLGLASAAVSMRPANLPAPAGPASFGP